MPVAARPKATDGGLLASLRSTAPGLDPAVLAMALEAVIARDVVDSPVPRSDWR